MGIRIYKPTSPGRRKSSVQDFSDITKKRPERSLTVHLKKKSGRNNTGKITVRHQGGGVKRQYRLVDFNRTRYDVSAEVLAIEYDPNRNARIALVQYTDGAKSYILAPQGLVVGQKVISSANGVEAVSGNRMPLEYIPVGLFVYNIELIPGKGGQVVRSAGSGAQLQTLEGKFAQLKFPSGEIRLIPRTCKATVGRVSNSDFALIRWGKAGRTRHRGIRPTVRGKVMNPVDHPHGGGEGSNPIGLKGGPKTMWGKKAMGVKTRKHKKSTNQYILRRRGKNRKK